MAANLGIEGMVSMSHHLDFMVIAGAAVALCVVLQLSAIRLGLEGEQMLRTQPMSTKSLRKNLRQAAKICC